MTSADLWGRRSPRRASLDLSGLQAALRDQEARIIGALSVRPGVDALVAPQASKEAHRGDITQERAYWTEALLATIRECMEEQTKQLQGSLADEVRKQTQQLQSFLPDAWKGVGVAEEVRRGSGTEVDELRAVVRADVQEVVRAELQVDELRALLDLRNVHADTEMRTSVRHTADRRGSQSLRSPRRGSLTTPILNEEPDDDAPPLLNSDGPRKDKSSRELGYSLLEEERKTSFLELASSLYPQIGYPFTKLLEKLDDLWDAKEPPRSGAFATCVFSKFFQAFFSAVIMANACFMSYSVNRDLQHLSNENAAEAPSWMANMDLIFLLLYIAELLCKLCVHRLFYFWNEDFTWNWLDFVLILQGLLECLAGGGGRGNTWMRTLRLLRVAKVLRILRVVKFFTQLHLIISAIIGSVLHLLWSMLVFAILFFMFSLLITSSVATSLQDLDSVGSQEAKDALLYYGSVQLSMMTLYMTVTGGNDWSEFYFALGPASLAQYGFVFFVAFSQIALLNVVTGIFVENAMKVSKPNVLELANERFEEERDYAIELQKIMEEADEDDDGLIERWEFDAMVRAGKLTNLLKFVGIDPMWSRSNLPNVYDHVLEQQQVAGRGTPDGVKISALVERIMALRGAARSTEIMDLHDSVWDLKVLQEEMMLKMGSRR